MIKMTWDEYGMELAKLVSRKSKDPSTQCGCVILDRNNRIVSTGYNGFPRAVPDDVEFLLNRDTKYKLVLHAEQNAVIFAQRDLYECTAYVWPMPPCSHCAAMLVQARISRVITCQPTVDQLDRWGESFSLSAWLFRHAGVKYRVTGAVVVGPSADRSDMGCDEDKL